MKNGRRRTCRKLLTLSTFSTSCSHRPARHYTPKSNYFQEVIPCRAATPEFLRTRLDTHRFRRAAVWKDALIGIMRPEVGLARVE
jgi:hypothetical protein